MKRQNKKCQEESDLEFQKLKEQKKTRNMEERWSEFKRTNTENSN